MKYIIFISWKTILDYNYASYQGCFAENYVAQQLISTHHKNLVSWQENRSEIEFLFNTDNKIILIEVKSGMIRRTQSLKKFIEKYQPKTSITLSAKNININKKTNVLHLPLYLTDQIHDFL